MRVLGIDYGRRRIGLALSDPTGLLASAWKTMARDGNTLQVAATLAREIEALRSAGEDVSAIVIGCPRHLDGERHELAAAIDGIAARLRLVTRLPVHLQDERLTSHEAEERLKAGGHDWRERKARIDAVAAAILLQDYLDAQPRRAPDPEPHSVDES